MVSIMQQISQMYVYGFYYATDKKDVCLKFLLCKGLVRCKFIVSIMQQIRKMCVYTNQHMSLQLSFLH